MRVGGRLRNGLQTRIQNKGDLYERKNPNLVTTNGFDVLRRTRQELCVHLLNLRFLCNRKITDKPTLNSIEDKFRYAAQDLETLTKRTLELIEMEEAGKGSKSPPPPVVRPKFSNMHSFAEGDHTPRRGLQTSASLTKANEDGLGGSSLKARILSVTSPRGKIRRRSI